MAPAVRSAPSTERKLDLLAAAASHDLACACGPSTPRTRGPAGRWIYQAALPSGERVPMLKVLQQSGCERGCAYCVERLGGVAGAAAGVGLGADELARLFADMHRAGLVFGLFLSSAIRGGAAATMDRMLATAEMLRGRHRYRGYLHLKIVPGCRPEQIDRAMELATRVSVNLEVPTARHLRAVAPSKRFDEHILAAMRRVAAAEAAGRYRRSGQTTQLVVGAAGETDRDIGAATAWLYGDLRLARVYYSALQPHPGTPLEGRPPTPFLREHRLYQMDFLLRKYGFGLDELPFEADGALPAAEDPKTAWAHRHRGRFPLEVNTAALEDLVRVPGIGPESARRLVRMRAAGRLRDLAALRAAGARWRTAAPWVLLDGRRPPEAGQLSLF